MELLASTIFHTYPFSPHLTSIKLELTKLISIKLVSTKLFSTKPNYISICLYHDKFGMAQHLVLL